MGGAWGRDGGEMCAGPGASVLPAERCPRWGGWPRSSPAVAAAVPPPAAPPTSRSPYGAAEAGKRAGCPVTARPLTPLVAPVQQQQSGPPGSRWSPRAPRSPSARSPPVPPALTGGAAAPSPSRTEPRERRCRCRGRGRCGGAGRTSSPER